MSIAPHKRVLIKFIDHESDKEFSIYANYVRIDTSDEIICQVDMGNIITEGNIVLDTSSSRAVPFTTYSNFMSTCDPATMIADLFDATPSDSITLGSQDTNTSTDDSISVVLPRNNVTMTGTTNAIMNGGTNNGIVPINPTTSVGQRCTCTTSTQVCKCYDTVVTNVNETQYDELIDLTLDNDATEPQVQNYDEDDESTVIAEETDKYDPYVATDSDDENPSKKQKSLRLRDGPTNFNGGRPKDRNTIWHTRRRKVRSDKGTMRGIKCNICMEGRTLVATCGRCHYDVCLKCVTELKEHGRYVNICVQCRGQM